MLVLPSLLLAVLSLPALTLSAPSTTPPSIRSSVSRLSPTDRRQLAQTIALHLFARDANDQVDPSVLHDEVLLFLESLEAEGKTTKLASFRSGPASASSSSRLESEMDKRFLGGLFGGDDDEGVLTGYAPAKVACPSGEEFIRVARVSLPSRFSPPGGRHPASPRPSPTLSKGLDRADRHSCLSDPTRRISRRPNQNMFRRDSTRKTSSRTCRGSTSLPRTSTSASIRPRQPRRRPTSRLPSQVEDTER